jgi:hypothetical protein
MERGYADKQGRKEPDFLPKFPRTKFKTLTIPDEDGQLGKVIETQWRDVQKDLKEKVSVFQSTSTCGASIEEIEAWFTTPEWKEVINFLPENLSHTLSLTHCHSLTQLTQ